MLHKKRGSNQFKKRYEPWQVNLIKGTIIIALIFAIFWKDNTQIVRPVPTYTYANELPSPTPTPTISQLEEVVAYITKKFEPEGKHVVIEAINCFYSESGLRPEAYNFNKNQTEDRGIAQINSVHGLSPEEAHDIYKNIDKAYEIYKSRGDNWSAWYGSGCNN